MAQRRTPPGCHPRPLSSTHSCFCGGPRGLAGSSLSLSSTSLSTCSQRALWTTLQVQPEDDYPPGHHDLSPCLSVRLPHGLCGPVGLPAHSGSLPGNVAQTSVEIRDLGQNPFWGGQGSGPLPSVQVEGNQQHLAERSPPGPAAWSHGHTALARATGSRRWSFSRESPSRRKEDVINLCLRNVNETPLFSRLTLEAPSETTGISRGDLGSSPVSGWMGQGIPRSLLALAGQAPRMLPLGSWLAVSG